MSDYDQVRGIIGESQIELDLGPLERFLGTGQEPDYFANDQVSRHILGRLGQDGIVQIDRVFAGNIGYLRFAGTKDEAAGLAKVGLDLEFGSGVAIEGTDVNYRRGDGLDEADQRRSGNNGLIGLDGGKVQGGGGGDHFSDADDTDGNGREIRVSGFFEDILIRDCVF